MKETTEQVPRKFYVCDICGEKFTNKKKCKRHEKRCGCQHNFILDLDDLDCGEMLVRCKTCNLTYSFRLYDKRNTLPLLEFFVNAVKTKKLSYDEH